MPPPLGSLSITTTKRRRFFWCAWWTTEPSRQPFTKPDAFSGGARSLEEARKQAERAAGRPLREIDPIWARAFVRVQAGQTPWVEKKPRTRPKQDPPPHEGASRKRFVPSTERPHECPFAVLGLPKTASLEDIRKAFRRLALETHPDQGGDTASFIRITWARNEASLRAKRV